MHSLVKSRQLDTWPNLLINLFSFYNIYVCVRHDSTFFRIKFNVILWKPIEFVEKQTFHLHTFKIYIYKQNEKGQNYCPEVYGWKRSDLYVPTLISQRLYVSIIYKIFLWQNYKFTIIFDILMIYHLSISGSLWKVVFVCNRF